MIEMFYILNVIETAQMCTSFKIYLLVHFKWMQFTIGRLYHKKLFKVIYQI